jgi:hypothetical protein
VVARFILHDDGSALMSPTAVVPQLVEGPGGGLVTHLDPRHVPDQAWSNGRNVRFPTGGSRVQKTDGYTRIDQTFPAEPIREIWNFYDTKGGQQFIRITTNRVLRGLGSGTQDISHGSTQALTLDDVVTIDQYKDEMYWADGKNKIMRYGGVGTADTALPGGLPNGKLVEIHKDRLLLGNITQLEPEDEPLTIQPWRVMYSAIGDPRDFAGTLENDTAGFWDFLEDNAPIIALKVLGDHAIVHKPSRMYRMIAIGPPDHYQVEQIPGDDGAISARSPISIGSHQYYMGSGNFYRLGAFTEPLGDAIWPEIERNIDWNKAGRIYAYRRQEYDEIGWKIPRLASMGGGDLSAMLNWRDNSWTLTDHDPGTCYNEFPQVPWFTPTAVSHLPPVVGVFGQESGHIQAYDTPNADGAAIHAWVESKHFVSLQPSKVHNVVCYGSGTGTLWVNCRAAMELRQPMPPWGTAQALVLNPSQTRPWVDVRKYGRLWQVRIESNGLNDEWNVSSYGPAVIPGGYAR